MLSLSALQDIVHLISKIVLLTGKMFVVLPIGKQAICYFLVDFYSQQIGIG